MNIKITTQVYPYQVFVVIEDLVQVFGIWQFIL